MRASELGYMPVLQILLDAKASLCAKTKVPVQYIENCAVGSEITPTMFDRMDVRLFIWRLAMDARKWSRS
jgi:hypothetical protein